MPRALGLPRGRFALCLALLLTLSSAVPAGLGSSHGVRLLSADGTVGGNGQDAVWMQVDQQVGLDGLWGSIDTSRDIDPFLLLGVQGGTDHLFWASWDGLRYQAVHAWRPQGGAWVGPEAVDPVAPAGSSELTPRAVIGAEGLLHVAWTRTAIGSSRVFHAARLAAGWTGPTLLSGTDYASQPFMRVDGSHTLVDYQTMLEMVTVEVTVVGYSGGSDDIDPTLVEVGSSEVGRRILPR